MYILCSDLEGVLFPEIWINVAEKTGIKELRLTTRDIPDYDVLMKKRIVILHENGLKLSDIQDVINTLDPLEGAAEFFDWLRAAIQVIILSDTFVEFAGPLMKKLGWPTIFCNSLSIAPNGAIAGYRLRQNDGKRKTVLALKSLNYKTIGVGDSYNDITMLKEADQGVLFRPPENVQTEYPDFSVCHTYEDLKTVVQQSLAGETT